MVSVITLNPIPLLLANAFIPTLPGLFYRLLFVLVYVLRLVLRLGLISTIFMILYKSLYTINKSNIFVFFFFQ